jgi:hypothetical protein
MTKGSKYEDGRKIKDIAVLIRKDIKEAQKIGHIEAGIDVRVRSVCQSGKNYIDIELVNVPYGFRVFTTNPYEFRKKTTRMQGVLDKLSAIVNAYKLNIDCECESNFYSYVGIDPILERAIKDKEAVMLQEIK